VGEKTAAQLVRRFKDLDGIIASGRVSATAIEYIQKARRVGVPVGIAPVKKPTASRPIEARDPTMLASLNETYGVKGSTDRLLQALARRTPVTR
jgi:5'-3' exonuclease